MTNYKRQSTAEGPEAIGKAITKFLTDKDLCLEDIVYGLSWAAYYLQDHVNIPEITDELEILEQAAHRASVAVVEHGKGTFA